MGSAAKFGLLILMALVIALARFLEGEVKPRRSSPPSLSVAQALVHGKKTSTSRSITKAEEKRLNSFSRAGAQAQSLAPVKLRQAAPAAPAKPKKRTYKARKRDTLGRISRKMYGSTRHWRTILKANHSVLKGNEKRLKPGMTLLIPEIKKSAPKRR
jgi:hypothetical protein